MGALVWREKNSSASDSVCSYDERVELAIDQALKLCDIQEEEDCGVENCGDLRTSENCGAENCGNMERATKIECKVVRT